MNVKLKRDGLTLRGELLLPEKDSYDIAILMHGFTGNRNGELLTALADALLEKGVASVRFDFNGHGDSDGKLEDMTVLNEIADAKVILDYAKSLEHVRNIFLFGHSQGGVVASMIAGYYPEVFKKIILSAPAATLKDDAIKGECQGTTYRSRIKSMYTNTPSVVFTSASRRVFRSMRSLLTTPEKFCCCMVTAIRS